MAEPPIRAAHRRPTPRSRFWYRRAVAVGVLAIIGLGAWRLADAVTGSPAGREPGGAAIGSPSPGESPSSSPEPTAPPLPDCAFAEDAAPSSGPKQWKRTLLDTTFALPEDYEPPELVSAASASFAEVHRVRPVVIGDLEALRDAALAAGHDLELIAAYRSYDQQAVLFEQREQELGTEGARLKVARPGHSEHQLGTAVDFRKAEAKDVTQAFGRTPQGRWLAENAWRFGFVLSYPDGQEDLTCYAYEPWHFRYFGRATAERIIRSGLTSREFLWRLKHGAAP